MNFYVYEWYNINTKEVFYVGKGSKNRYRSKQHRNKLFLQYCESNEVSSRIVKEFNSEIEAFEWEKQLTDSYRLIGQCQCNLMDGGYGGYSSVWTREMKNYFSENNPMKHSDQRKRMQENNPMKNPELAKQVNSKNKRPVIINNIEYESVKDAAIAAKVWDTTVSNWCKRGYDTLGNPCRYKDEKQKEYTKKRTNSKGVLIDNQYYYVSLQEAATLFFKVKDTSPLSKALRSNKTYHGHIVEYANQQPSQ